MFTGIIQSVGKISDSKKDEDSHELFIESSLAKKLSLGSSISVSGVCLTVTDITDRTFSVNLMPQTQIKTTLGELKTGDLINLESSLRLGDEMGGHFVFGHVDTTGRVEKVVQEKKVTVLTIKTPHDFLNTFIAPQGSVALDGVSLTVADRTKNSFAVSLTPYTLKHTTLKNLTQGDRVNLEGDMLARYVHQFTSKS